MFCADDFLIGEAPVKQPDDALPDSRPESSTDSNQDPEQDEQDENGSEHESGGSEGSEKADTETKESPRKINAITLINEC